MVDPSPARGYDASRRRATAQRSRLAVLDACRELVLQDGYKVMTIRAVAERAGVSAEFVYKAFGGKPQLLKAVYDVTLAGDDESLPMGQRAELRAVFAAADASAALAGYAAFVGGVHDRLAGLLVVLAGSDPELAEVAAETDAERLRGVTAFVGHLAASGWLRPGLAVAEAADSCWVLTSPQVFDRLRRSRDWDAEACRSWLERLLAAALLPPAPGCGSGGGAG
jgi:AcrR family transcriptional regulator